jgi:hypothetical protein
VKATYITATIRINSDFETELLTSGDGEEQQRLCCAPTVDAKTAFYLRRKASAIALALCGTSEMSLFVGFGSFEFITAESLKAAGERLNLSESHSLFMLLRGIGEPEATGKGISKKQLVLEAYREDPSRGIKEIANVCGVSYTTCRRLIREERHTAALAAKRATVRRFLGS